MTLKPFTPTHRSPAIRPLTAPVAALCLLWGSNACALTAGPAEDSLFYYRIGGAAPITSAPNPAVVTAPLSLRAGLNYSCGKFDPTLGIVNALNPSRLAATLQDTALGAATAAAGALPLYVLKRANPDLYQLLQDALLAAKGVISLATKSCEQMEAQVRAGKNPYDDWATLAIGDSWKRKMGTGGFGSSTTDVAQAQEDINNEDGKNGVDWINGAPAGGVGQAPIRPIADTTQAGYNLSLNRSVTATSPATGAAAATPLAQLWSSPAQARAWLIKVVGDIETTTYTGGPRNSTPGQGLAPEMDATTATVRTDLANLVSGATSPTLVNLETVSAPGMAITRQVVEAIRALSPSDRGIAVSRLAGEIAMAKTMEKALLARRLLLTGRMEPNIAKVDTAQQSINRAVTELDRAIEDLLFESRVRQEIVSGTVREVLNYDSARKRRALQAGGVAPVDPHPLVGGAVR
ncbi:MAG: integrating conjugative element protein [Gammaproteobacteria bacterium]|nr:integrating conjugative element protein [Gammaproteobacteria bacterium]